MVGVKVEGKDARGLGLHKSQICIIHENVRRVRDSDCCCYTRELEASAVRVN
jgi:hypothetical protein